MPRLSDLQQAAPVRLSDLQPRQPSHERVDPQSLRTEMEAYDAMHSALRAGDQEAADRYRARAQEIMVASMPAHERFLAGIGKSIHDTGLGIGQLLGRVSDEEIAEVRQRDEALMNSGSGLAGNIVGQGLQMAVPLGKGGRIAAALGKAAPFAGAAARGGGFAALQGTTGDETRGENALLGGLLGAAGQGVASGAARLASGIQMDDVTRGLLAKADDAGLRLGAGQLTENRMARTVIDQLERLPFSGARAARDANQAAFNRAVAGTFGASDDKITGDAFKAAKLRIGNEFERLANQNTLRVTPQLKAQLAAIRDDASRLSAGPETGKAVGNWIDDLLSKADGDAIPGRLYQSFDSKVGKAMRPGGETASYLGDIREAVRAAMDDSISAADQGAWRTARQQWANLKTVEPLVAKSATGDIAPAQLMGRVTADNAGKVRMASGGGGQLGDLAKVGQRFLKDAPDSGTADRLMANLSVPVAAGGLLGAQQLNIISPETAAITAGLLAANRGGLGLLRNPALVRGASPLLHGTARAAAAARTLPAAAANARQREEPLLIDIGGGRRVTLEEARRMNGY